MLLLDGQEIVLMHYLSDSDLEYGVAQTKVGEAVKELSVKFDRFDELVKKMKDLGYVSSWEKEGKTYLGLTGTGDIRFDRERRSFLYILNPLFEKDYKSKK
jgi:hypothetical protein